jgi:pyruvate,water dikinase
MRVGALHRRFCPDPVAGSVEGAWTGENLALRTSHHRANTVTHIHNEDSMNNVFPVTWDDPADAELSWEWGEGEGWAGILAPLAADAAQGITEGFNDRYQRNSLPLRSECRIIHGYAYLAQRPLVAPSELPALYERIREIQRSEARHVREQWDAVVLPALLESYTWIRSRPIASAPLTEVAVIWDEVWQQRVPQFGALHAMITPGALQSLQDLADLYQALFEQSPPGEGLKLVQGLPNELQQVQRDLHLLAARARALPAVAELILHQPDQLLDSRDTVEGGIEFTQALDAFLTAHGHLGQPFFDLALPSWADEPLLLLTEIRKRLLDSSEDPEKLRLRRAVEAELLTDEVRTRLRSRPAARRRFEETLNVARKAGPLSEGHNYWLDRMAQAHLHRFAIQVGQRLVQAHVCADAHDIFFLHADETRAALQDPCDLRDRIEQRRADHHQWQKVRPPRYLGKQPEQPDAVDSSMAAMSGQIEPTVLHGISASAGTARGPVRVVLSPTDFGCVQRGDVLVCATSNPSWVPIFGIIQGLIASTGGALSHAAVVAREFGVPAVVGAGEAVLHLRDGQLVEVDGTAGEIRILE